MRIVAAYDFDPFHCDHITHLTKCQGGIHTLEQKIFKQSPILLHKLVVCRGQGMIHLLLSWGYFFECPNINKKFQKTIFQGGIHIVRATYRIRVLGPKSRAGDTE